MPESGLFTGEEALVALRPLGFEVIRTTDVVEIAKGAMKLRLPKGEEYLNPILNQNVVGIIESLREKAINAGQIKRDNGVPLMVTYDGRVFAVVENRHPQWQLQDLDDGRRFSVLKTQCKTYDPEPKERVTVPDNGTAPKLTVHQIPEELPPEPVEEIKPLTNPSSVAALVRMTQQRLAAIEVEMEQAKARYELAKQNYDATVVFLRTLGFEPDAPPPAIVETKRTVLPPSGPGRTYTPGGSSSTSSVPQPFKDRMKMAWLNLGKPSGYGYMQKVKERVIADGGTIDFPDNTLYAVMKEIRGS